ncbi:hypothetical protein E2C01_081782 [Portunus trituberculatus]|uniref:Uncharacterized protein n=1 Tax=Portunus trituberculatus TaxID=210409 RepID=A0A5B7IXE2_PORTR|nr:hypothetical protein [Portunus trituberculatus]
MARATVLRRSQIGKVSACVTWGLETRLSCGAASPAHLSGPGAGRGSTSPTAAARDVPSAAGEVCLIASSEQYALGDLFALLNTARLSSAALPMERALCQVMCGTTEIKEPHAGTYHNRGNICARARNDR